MFTILKQQLKHKFAHFLYNFLKTRHDVEHWTRTTSCCYCAKPIAVNGQFCTYCGRAIKLPPQAASTNRDPKAPITEPISRMSSEHIEKRHFLNYVRTQKEHVGPATQAHRIFQDYEQKRC